MILCQQPRLRSARRLALTGKEALVCLLLFVLPVAAQASDLLQDALQLRMKGELKEARSLLEERLRGAPMEASEEISLRLELARIHNRLGLHFNTRPVPEALEHLRAAADLAPRQDDQSRAHIELALAEYYYDAEMAGRQFTAAKAHAERALGMFQRRVDRHAEADAVHRLGLIRMQQGQLDEARDLFDRSLELDQAGSERVFFRGEYERHVGFVHMLKDDTGAAVPHLERSLHARRRAGAVDASLFAAQTLASALVDLGRSAEAKPYLLYALTVAERIGSPVGKARTGIVLGRMYALEGELDAARIAYETALAAADSVRYESVAEQARAALSRLQRQVGQEELR